MNDAPAPDIPYEAPFPAACGELHAPPPGLIPREPAARSQAASLHIAEDSACNAREAHASVKLVLPRRPPVQPPHEVD